MSRRSKPRRKRRIVAVEQSADAVPVEVIAESDRAVACVLDDASWASFDVIAYMQPGTSRRRFSAALRDLADVLDAKEN